MKLEIDEDRQRATQQQGDNIAEQNNPAMFVALKQPLSMSLNVIVQ